MNKVTPLMKIYYVPTGCFVLVPLQTITGMHSTVNNIKSRPRNAVQPIFNPPQYLINIFLHNAGILPPIVF